MTCWMFYTIALPFIVIGSVSSYKNYRIQESWYKDYKEDRKKEKYG